MTSLTPEAADEEGESLSSWAARWNADADEEDEQVAAEAEPAAPEASAAEPEASSTDSEANEREPETPSEPESEPVADTPTDVAPQAELESEPQAEPESKSEPQPEPESEPQATDEPTPAPEEPDLLAGMTAIPAGSSSNEYSWKSTPDPESEPEPEVGLAPASDAAAAKASSDAVLRAESLLDELRDLLPSLAAATTTEDETPPAPGIDTNAVADELSAALPESDRFSDLRETLETARANPRDIDTMLSIVGRAGDLIDLLDTRDALESAISTAIARLRNDS